MGLREIRARVLVDGEGAGPVLVLGAPLSFWGGVDPETGVVTQPRHPDHRRCLAGQVVAMNETIGSSSSSAVLLELVHRGVAPAALVLGRSDAVLALGAVVAAEMGYAPLPVLEYDVSELAGASSARIERGGRIVLSD